MNGENKTWERYKTLLFKAKDCSAMALVDFETKLIVQTGFKVTDFTKNVIPEYSKEKGYVAYNYNEYRLQLYVDSPVWHLYKMEAV